jgi:hypothetical protein
MKTKIQQAGDYSLHVQFDSVEVTDGVRMQFCTLDDSARFPEEARVKLDVHMTKEEFALLCRAVNMFAVST